MSFKTTLVRWLDSFLFVRGRIVLPAGQARPVETVLDAYAAKLPLTTQGVVTRAGNQVCFTRSTKVTRHSQEALSFFDPITIQANTAPQGLVIEYRLGMQQMYFPMIGLIMLCGFYAFTELERHAGSLIAPSMLAGMLAVVLAVNISQTRTWLKQCAVS